MRRVVVHIDRLALHGLTAGEARAVTDALHAELEALMSGFSVPSSLSAPSPLQVDAAPPQRISAAPTPAALGRAAASAVANAVQASATGSRR